MDIETVSEAFVQFLQDEGIATFNSDLYLSQVPDSAPVTTYWLETSGGNPIQKLATGEVVKQYFINVNYRSNKAESVEKNLFRLENLLNCTECVNLEGFEVHEISASSFPSDEDIDSEDRRVGMLQASVQVYKKDC